MNSHFPNTSISFIRICCSIMLLALSCSPVPKTRLETMRLRCEYLEEPLGLDTPAPRFSWIIISDRQDVIQSGYEIQVSENDPGFAVGSLVWNPGFVSATQSVNISYAGESLKSRTTYYWRLRVKDKQGNESSWSPVSRFHTGFLGTDNFSAEWIMHPDKTVRSPFFRKEFKSEKMLESACIYITSIGIYELYLNGKKIEDRLFEPASTQYSERILYTVYDVSQLLDNGENTLGVWMGEGQSAFTKPPDGRFANINMKVPSYDRPMLLLELKLNYSDGTSETLSSDTSWKCSGSPLVFNNYFGGEDYDARLEKPGWASPSYNDTDWEPAGTGWDYKGIISAQLLQPARELETFTPVTELQRDERTIEYDFGTTIGGYWEIEVEGEAGEWVRVRGSEKCGGELQQWPLTEDNLLWWEGNHSGKYFYKNCWSKYILKGEGREVYKPRFFYQGHRYLELLLSDPEKVKLVSVKNISTGNSVDRISEFTCSDDYLNHLHDMVVQTFRNNLIQGVPLSNPNSEKYGWTGDVHLFAESADYSLDMAAFWTKWMQDFPDAMEWAGGSGNLPVTVPEFRRMGPLPDITWLAVYPFILENMYRNHMDSELLVKHYEPLSKWYDFVLDLSEDYIIGGVFGDHLIPSDDMGSSFSTGPMNRILNTAYLYRITNILAEISQILGRQEEKVKYEVIAMRMAESFDSKFYREDQGIYEESPSPEGYHYDLASNLVPLQMGIVPEEKRAGIISYLKEKITAMDYRVFTGILGTKAFIDVFQKEDREFLYRIIQNRQFPGWGYTIDELGASTLNQNWNGQGDYNHCMYGSVLEFFYNDLLGIRTDFTGEENIILIDPFLPADLEYASGKTLTACGEVLSGWVKTGDKIKYVIRIPANTVCRFSLSDELSLMNLTLNGEVLEEGSVIHSDSGPAMLNLGSGNYIIEANKH